MDFTFYALMVTIAAVIYAGIIRAVQYKLGNQAEMQEFQKKSKELSEKLKEASKNKDNKRMDELMKEQAALLGGMNKMMFGQFKVMFVILGIFFAFTWGVSQFDPTVKDDIKIILLDDGKLCDITAGDGIFTTCYTPAGNEYGSWSVDLKALKSDGSVIGENSTYFYYNAKEGPLYVKTPKGSPLGVSVSQKSVNPGEQVTIYAVAPSGTSSVSAHLDAGTRFYVDLPFAIPIIEVKRINETYWWFIFAALISGLVISFVMGKMTKKEVAKPGEKK
jgi:hypothetical protein